MNQQKTLEEEFKKALEILNFAINHGSKFDEKTQATKGLLDSLIISNNSCPSNNEMVKKIIYHFLDPYSNLLELQKNKNMKYSIQEFEMEFAKIVLNWQPNDAYTFSEKLNKILHPTKLMKFFNFLRHPIQTIKEFLNEEETLPQIKAEESSISTNLPLSLITSSTSTPSREENQAVSPLLEISNCCKNKPSTLENSTITTPQISSINFTQ